MSDFDDELLFDDEPLPDELILSPSNQVSDAKPINILLFAQQQALTDQQQNILWPVYGWRIAAPQVSERKLDFLQLTSLRLAHAGVTRHQDQAQMLGQHKDFLFNVMLQLENQGYIDRKARLTDKGEKILQQDGKEDEEKTEYGWIFQDATAGELLSWFYTKSLRYADSSRSDVSQAFQLPWIRQTLPTPNAADVTSAIKTQRRLLKLIQADNAVSDAYGFTEISKADILTQSNNAKVEQTENFGVRLLSKRPQQFYLLVSCIIEGTSDGQFSLRCPFGLPDGFRWVRLLNFASSQCEEGKKIVEHLQSKSREAWKRKQPREIEPIGLAREAYDKIIFEVGSVPDKIWQQVWQELERLEQSRILLERGFDETDTSITRSQRVLEQLMFTLLQLDTIPTNIWEPYKSRDTLQQCLKDTVVACGGSEIPERILFTKLGAIRNVLDGGKDSLRPYVGTFLLSASRRNSLHRCILEYLLKKHLDFLADIEKIAHIRNTIGAHAGISHKEPSIVVEDLVTKTYQIVRLVIEAWRLTNSQFSKEV
ncbi:hypothetical protein H6G64_10470 [Calothrix sp. FACHB-156]|nr:hypothetical protein [Calothrix sp. FACHB-156]MBD2514689.1 hypothetical protein [Nostoc sp. FACHB-973]